jgi:hypothetical protein
MRSDQVVKILELSEVQLDFLIGILKRDKVGIKERLEKLQSYEQRGVKWNSKELNELRTKYRLGDEILNLIDE